MGPAGLVRMAIIELVMGYALSVLWLAVFLVHHTQICALSALTDTIPRKFQLTLKMYIVIIVHLAVSFVKIRHLVHAIFVHQDISGLALSMVVFAAIILLSQGF